MAHIGHGSKKKYRLDLSACLRNLFQPSFWKRMHGEFEKFESGRTKWRLPLCFFSGLFMALDPSATMQERFECARERVTALFPKRRRCGTTLAGYSEAIANLPLVFFQRIKEELLRKLNDVHIHAAKVGRWHVYAIDGSIQNLPRTLAHELKYGISTKGTASGAGFPQRQVVAAVAMGKNVMWDWECSSALIGEREQALKIIARLPPCSLSVLDAGFLGYAWAKRIVAMNRFFLVRVGANVRLWVNELNHAECAEWRDGEVWLWPDNQRSQAPVVLRLIRIEIAAAGNRKKSEMWLVTNILDETKLTRGEASQLYQKRWRANECTFRDWKRTMDAAKLDSRTPAMAEREEEFGLCAMQVLQVTTLLARKQHRKEHSRSRSVSVAKAQRAWRRAARALAASKRTLCFSAQIAECVADSYVRKSKKVRRAWPERKAHESPKAPVLRRLEKRLKANGLRKLEEQKAIAS